MGKPKQFSDEELKQHRREWEKVYLTKKRKDPVFRAKRRSYDLSPSRRLRVVRRLAKKKNISFTITLEQYINLLSHPCYYCGQSLYGEYGVGLDRVNNDRVYGYTLDNVLPCCSECNKGRNKYFTVAEFKVMITALLKYRQSKSI